MKILRRTIIFILLVVMLLFGVKNYIMPKFQHKQATKPITAFNLIDTNGNPFNEKSLRGHWTIVFFGYPGCPDICPRTLNILRETWDMYTPPKLPPARFVFVNIDSKPTSNDTLKAFLGNYNSTFIGISGTPAATAKLSGQLGIFHNEQPDRIDHSTALLLINPQARLTTVFTPPFTAQEIVKEIDILTHR